MGLAIAGVGALFGVGYLVNVMLPMVVAAVTAFSIRVVYVLRGDLPAGGVWAHRGFGLFPEAPVAFRDVVPLLFFMGYMTLVEPMSFSLWVSWWTGLALIVELVARVARRRGASGWWSAYDSGAPEDNWSRYLGGLGAATGITLTLILVQSELIGLGGVLALLLVVVAGTTALVRRLALNSAVKREWDRMYGAGPAAAG